MKRIQLVLSALLLFMACGANAQQTKSTEVESAFTGYLFAYFEGKSDPKKREQLRFATSIDGINWRAMNTNFPVITSDTISSTGGIRDPHLLRRKDNGFYLVATDMFTAKDGWGANPGIVLMKSDNLTDWKHHALHLEQTYPKKFKGTKWVWAPQTFYDAAKDKYLIYFTVKFEHNDKLDFYAAYANKDFSGFESEPKLLFSPKFGGIDGDIILDKGVYHFFYKGNVKDASGTEIQNGIKVATSKSLFGPWKESEGFIDSYANTKTPVEGSSIFKLHSSDEYILMYDLYTEGRYEFQRSKDLKTFTEKPESFTKNFDPRHGSVIAITKEEARALDRKWGDVVPALVQPNTASDRYVFQAKGNPIIRHHYTADPAALVKNDTLWLYAGHDFKGGQNGYKMKDWLVYSTTDMKEWTEYPVPLRIEDFPWANSKDAFAAHVTERNGKYYYYVSTNGSGIGVAVADRPQGPFKDALGKPLLTIKDCFASTHSWACIDPAVFIDDDGQAWIFWGNRECYYAKLKDNMIEIDGEIKQMDFKGFSFTEAPWIHKYKGKYYLTYATGFPEKIEYAMADRIDGPYEYKGILNEIAGNSNTNHQAILAFKNQWYFIYHNGALQTEGTSYSRSICIDRMEYNADGTIKRIQMTTEGVQ